MDPQRLSALLIITGFLFIRTTRLIDDIPPFFEPVGNGTKVKFEAELDAKGFFKLAEPIAGRMLQRQTAADAETLKEILEAGV